MGSHIAVADLQIFRGGFSFTKTKAKLEVKTKKKHNKLLNNFLLTAASLDFSTAPKPTCDLCSSHYQSSLIRGVRSFRGGCN